MEVSFHPTIKQIEEIKNWLIEEDKNKDGFYCNWSIINERYNKGQLAIISKEKETVGFVTWYSKPFIGTIEIAEIKLTHRNKGYGKKLIESLLKKFINQNIYAVSLMCSPAKSEHIWKKMGFQDIPNSSSKDRFSPGSSKQLYKILIPVKNLCAPDNSNNGEFIEIWNNQKGYTQKEPNWKWHLSFKTETRELELPIIFPASYQWRIRWRLNDRIIKDTDCEYFSQEEIYSGEFIVIKALPQI